MTMEEYEEINLDELKDGGATRDPSVPKETKKRTDGKKKRRAHKDKKRKRKAYIRVVMCLQINGDEDILDYLEKMKNEHGYTPTQIFKDLIRKEIEQ